MLFFTTFKENISPLLYKTDKSGNALESRGRWQPHSVTCCLRWHKGAFQKPPVLYRKQSSNHLLNLMYSLMWEILETNLGQPLFKYTLSTCHDYKAE